VESLEDVEHRAVVIVEKSAGDVNAEIRRHPDQILVERPMVDRAQRESVAHDWLTQPLRVADDVGGVEEPDLAEAADGAAIGVRGKDRAAELCLMDPLLDFTNDVPPLDLVGDVDGLALVVRAAHPSEREEDAEILRIILFYIGRVDRLVVIRPRADELNDRYVE
jgi:hypothetical protein